MEYKYWTEEKQDRVKQLLNENKVLEVEFRNNAIDIRLDNGKEISISSVNGSTLEFDVFMSK
jgi:hypothetical protein